MSGTPPVHLSLVEVGPMLLGIGILACQTLFAIATRILPLRNSRTPSDKRRLWHEIALVVLKSRGRWFSIRHLQFLRPSTGQTIQAWAKKNRTTVFSENVDLVSSENGDTKPVVHWIGIKPTRDGVASGRKVVLYLHGGGFVFTLYAGHITMITTLMKEANSSLDSATYLAMAEYTLAPYAQYPTQLHQIVSIIHHLYKSYHLPSSSLVLAGDSAGGALVLSILSHFLHPKASPSSLHPLPYKLHTDPPIAGMLLLSPWTSFSTSSPSYTQNAQSDFLDRNIVCRFRDSYIAGSPFFPQLKGITHTMEVSGVAGRSYTIRPDPAIPGLKFGVGAIRPPGSGPENGRGGEDDAWWAEVGSAVSKICITVGEDEVFKDDIVACANQIRRAMMEGSTGSGRKEKGELKLLREKSGHAITVVDFSLGLPESEMTVEISRWMTNVLRR